MWKVGIAFARSLNIFRAKRISKKQMAGSFTKARMFGVDWKVLYGSYLGRPMPAEGPYRPTL